MKKLVMVAVIGLVSLVTWAGPASAGVARDVPPKVALDHACSLKTVIPPICKG